MMFENNKQFMQRFMEETINKKNLDAIDEFVDEDFVEHVPFPGQGPGREGLKYAISTFVSAFPLKLPANYKIPPHTHPAVEHVTVLSGTFYMEAGDQLDREKAVALTPGSFAAFQSGHSMFAWTEEETVVQVHGVGPWGINYINQEDDPRKE